MEIKREKIIMKIPFEKYTVYVTFDDDKIYELKEDFSKELVSEMKNVNSEESNISS